MKRQIFGSSSRQSGNQRQKMAINRTPPLDERIRATCAEAEALVDA
jgi:hypothetical protein